ncbi:MAG: hypothetical protein ACFE9S_00990 [Candidatus Hermodarchaeota archaeon]
MNNFFKLYTLTPWDSLNSNELTEVKLLSLKNIFNTFPVIEPEFFDDILSNLYKHKHYSWIESIKRIIGPNAEDYDIEPWNLLWGMDTDRRIYQLLMQKTEEKAILVALAPPELGKLFTQYKKKAIIRILSLLNKPNMMKFLTILAPKGKSIAEEQQLLHVNKSELDKLKFQNMLKQMPNIKGQWFPEYSPRCPNCNKVISQIKGFNLAFLKFKCPYCGYKKN